MIWWPASVWSLFFDHLFIVRSCSENLSKLDVAIIYRNRLLPDAGFFFFIRKIGRYIYLIIVFFYEINNIWSDADSTNEAAFDLLVGISALAVNPLDFRIQRIFRKASAGYTETINISFIFENLGVFVNIAWRFRQHVLIDCNM